MRWFTMLAAGAALPSYGAMGRWVRHGSLMLLILADSSTGAGAVLRVAALDRPDAVTGDAVSDIPWEAVVRNAQRELAALGFYRGPLDGRFNAQLEKALRRFEQKYSVGKGGRSMRGTVERMRSMSAAMHLRRALTESGRRQQEQAASALRSNPSTRDLLGQGDAVGRSQLQSSRNARPHCHSAITVRCLLDEALRSVGNIESDTYRDWALREVVTAHVRTGNISDIRDTMRRISDPRLILVALRDVAETMSRHGDLAEAASLAATIPDLPNRAKAFAAIAVVRAENGDSVGAGAFTDRVLATLQGNPLISGGVGIATALAIKLIDTGEPALARRAVTAAKRLSVPGTDPMVRAAEVSTMAAMQAQAGNYDAVLQTLSRNRGGSGSGRSADTAVYRVLALSRLAETQMDRGDHAAATRSLVTAEAAVTPLRDGYPADAGRARIATAWMGLKAFERASMVILEVGNAARRARLLWLLSDSYLAAGDTGAARLIEEEALAATNSVKNGFERAAIKSDSALRLARRGDAAAARRLFAMALATGRGITTPWWRARAFARLASTLGGLERLGVRP
ncbi:MAG: peptidoglycan-binding protein [Alphaproteobacteria bacterium]|nr:peptidoglycan-binding protein [Alphaproteobacteria bacterium]